MDLSELNTLTTSLVSSDSSFGIDRSTSTDEAVHFNESWKTECDSCSSSGSDIVVSCVVCSTYLCLACVQNHEAHKQEASEASPERTNSDLAFLLKLTESELIKSSILQEKLAELAAKADQLHAGSCVDGDFEDFVAFCKAVRALDQSRFERIAKRASRFSGLELSQFRQKATPLIDELNQSISKLQLLYNKVASEGQLSLNRDLLVAKVQEMEKDFDEAVLEAHVAAFMSGTEFVPPKFSQLLIGKPLPEPSFIKRKYKPPALNRLTTDSYSTGLASPFFVFPESVRTSYPASTELASSILAATDNLRQRPSPTTPMGYPTPGSLMMSSLQGSLFPALSPLVPAWSFNSNFFAEGSRSTNLMSPLITQQMGKPQYLPTKCQIRRQKMIYHCKFGEFGHLEGQFTEPSGVAVNALNEILVADTNNHRIQIFDREGRFRTAFGECGKADGQLLYPNRVAVMRATNDIVVTERSPTHQVQLFTSEGVFIRKFGANVLQHPRGVCADHERRIIVVECKVMRVVIFDYFGRVLNKFGCSQFLEFPNGVEVSRKQEIFISDNRVHCVMVFNYRGEFLRKVGGEGITNYPIGVGLSPSGQITICDNHNNFNLSVFTAEGILINGLESKVKHAQCFDVALMDDGSVVLASKDYRIYIYKYLQPQVGRV